MSAQLGSRGFRYTIRGLMILVAVVAIALTWILWTQRPKPFPVSGTITYNGLPLGNGNSSFCRQPRQGGKPPVRSSTASIR